MNLKPYLVGNRIYAAETALDAAKLAGFTDLPSAFKADDVGVCLLDPTRLVAFDDWSKKFGDEFAARSEPGLIGLLNDPTF